MADTVSKGITITFRGDTVEFDNSVASMNRAMRLLQNETAKLNRELKLDPTNIDLLNQKLDLLKQREMLITDEIKRYKASLVEAIRPTTQLTSTPEWQKYQTEIQSATTKMNMLATVMNNLVNSNGQITDPVLWQQARKEYNETYDKWVNMRIALVELARENKASFDGKLVADYTGRMNNLEKELANVQIQADGVIQRINGIGTQKQIISLESLGKSLSTVGREFTVISNATRQLSKRALAGLGNMVNSASEFETAMAGVSKVLSDEELEKAGLTIEDIANAIRQMSKDIPATTTEIASIAEMAGQLGISADRIMDFSRVIADLGVATNISGGEGAKDLAQFLNIVGDSDAQHISNLASAIVALGNNSATTEDDILKMSKTLASAGTAIGLTQQEILALSTAMSSAGISASVGGNNLSKVLNAIDKAVGSGKYKEILPWAKQAGMSVANFKKAWNNMPIAVIKNLFDGLAEGNEKGKAFGTMLDSLDIKDMRTADVMRRLALSVENLDTYIDLSNVSWEENTALTTEAQKRYETFDSKMQMFSNSLKDLYITLGDKILPILTPIIDKTKEFFEKLGKADDETQKSVIGFTAFLAILSPLSRWLGNITGGLGTFFQALGMAKTGTADETTQLGGLAKAFSGLLNNKFITTASTQLGNLGGVLKDGFAKVKEFALGVAGNPSGYQSLVGAFNWLVQTIKDGPGVWIGKVGQMFSALWGIISANPIGVLVTILGVLAVAIVTALATSEDFRQKLSDLWTKIKKDLTPVIDGLVTAIKSLWSWIKEKLSPLVEPLVGIATSFVDLLSQIWDLIVNVVKALSEQFSPILSWLWETILKPLGEWLANTFVGTLKTVFGWIKDSIDLFTRLLGKANEYINTTKSYKNAGFGSPSSGGGGGSFNQNLKMDSRGLGINTSGLGAIYNGGTLQLTTNINVNNNGTPISETEIRKWGNTITEIVSNNLGRSFAV